MLSSVSVRATVKVRVSFKVTFLRLHVYLIHVYSLDDVMETWLERPPVCERAQRKL